tara:strand:+ start:157 stop:648 length:492 start_codon:yes stop_codon:yes gene_type:complete
MIPVEYETPPELKKLAREMKKLTRNLNDWRPVWDQVLPHMLGAVGSNFRSGGATTGKPWPPSKKEPGKATMILSGALLKNMTSRASVGTNITRKGASIFPTVGKYAYMMQAGAKRAGRKGRTKYPARPFLVWTEPAVKKAEQLSEEFVSQQTNKVQKGLEGLT